MAESERMQEEVYDYLDGLLSGQNRKAVQQRIETDPEYRSFFEDARAVRNNLQHLPKLKTSPDFDTVLRARIKMEKSLSRRRGLLDFPRSLPAYGALAVLILLVFVVAPRFYQQPTPAYTEDSPVRQVPEAAPARNIDSRQSGRPVNFPMDEIPQKSSVNPNLTLPSELAGQNQFSNDSTANKKQLPVFENNKPRPQNVNYQEF